MSFDNKGHPLAYAISDRRSLSHGEDVISFVHKAAAGGVDMIQIREKDLADRTLITLVRTCVDTARGTGARILVNDRLDIAVAAGAHGVHLGGHSAPAGLVRRHAPGHFVIGVSTHNDAEVSAAAEGGVDFITFGPVFPTQSKAKYGPPVGLDVLDAVLARTKLPVFPLGGVSESNLPLLMSRPIAGAAAISLFQKAADIGRIVQMIHHPERGD